MRYPDHIHSDALLDFVPRDRAKQIWNVLIGFAITMSVMLVLNFSPSLVGGRLEASLVSLVVICVLCFYIIYQKQQNLDLVLTTEFQNLLFAQAAALGFTFCLFIKRDGTIVYSNEGLKRLFPNLYHANSQALQVLYDIAHISLTDRERINSAIYGIRREHLIFPMKDASGDYKIYILTVDPLKRPSGYIVLRGREYHDTRSGSEMLPDILRSTNADHIEALLKYSPAAHYIADAFGTLEFVSPSMEALLGYSPGEMIINKIGLKHFLFRVGSRTLTDLDMLAEYEGEAALQKKQGESVNVTLTQRIVRNASGNITAIVGTAIDR
jgi:PAS domain S-box-containing protein